MPSVWRILYYIWIINLEYKKINGIIVLKQLILCFYLFSTFEFGAHSARARGYPIAALKTPPTSIFLRFFAKLVKNFSSTNRAFIYPEKLQWSSTHFSYALPYFNFPNKHSIFRNRVVQVCGGFPLPTPLIPNYRPIPAADKLRTCVLKTPAL